ncbi:MAG: C25 family cysteine peptidase [Bacteroidales bacterium]
MPITIGRLHPLMCCLLVTMGFYHNNSKRLRIENYFVEIDGNDFFPELLLGRLTNQSDYTLQVMLNKFKLYEQTPYTANSDWFKKVFAARMMPMLHKLKPNDLPLNG